MGLQKGFTDELNLKTAMPVTGPKAGDNLDAVILQDIEKTFDYPLRGYASATPDAFVNLSASTTLAGDGGTKVSSPVNGVGPATFASGKINFGAGTGALTGLGTITLNGSSPFATAFAALTKTTNQWRRFVFSQQQDGSVNVVTSAEAASEAALQDYGALAAQAGGTALFYVDVKWTGTQFQSPGQSGGIIGNDGIFRIPSGGGGGSASAGLAVQTASTPNITLTSGPLPLEDGRELASSDGGGTDTTNYFKALTVSATTILAASPTSIGGGGSPANSTLYYLYIDLDSLSTSPTTIATGTQTGRKIFTVVQANLVIGTTDPTAVNRSRYVYRGALKTTSGGAWSGTGAELWSAATLQGNNAPTAVSPVVYRLGKQLIGAVGSATTGAGHQISAKSFNQSIAAANTDWYPLTGLTDGNTVNARNLTNPGGNAVVFTGTGILGDSNGAASFPGTSSRLNSTSAQFNPATAFAFAIWVKPTGVAGTQTIAATQRVSGGSTTNWWVRMNTTTLEVLDSTAAVILSVPAAFAAGTWAHVGFRYDGTNGYAYINGQAVAGPTPFTPSSVTSPEFNLGANNPNGTPANFYVGVMDEMAFVVGTGSDADILKFYSARLDHSAAVATKNQEWSGNIYTDSDLAQPVSLKDVIVDVTDSNSLFLDLSQFVAGTDSVELALKDTGLSPTVVTPVPPFDTTYTSDPTGTVAHGQPDIPDVVLLMEDGTAGEWVQLANLGLVSADGTNLYLTTSALSPAVGASPNRLRVIARPARLASVGVPDANAARTGSVTPQAQTFAGDKTFTGSIKTNLAAKSADYTILDTDGFQTILVTTGASTRTMTLPLAANNVGRVITFKKVDSGAGKITIVRSGSNTIDGYTTTDIGTGSINQYAYLTVFSDGTNWSVVGCGGEVLESFNDTSTSASGTGAWAVVGSIVLPAGEFDVIGTVVLIRNAATFSSIDSQAAISAQTGSTAPSEALVKTVGIYQLGSQLNTFTNLTMPTPNVRVINDGTNLTVAGTQTSAVQTVNLKTNIATYSAGTPQVRYLIRARRIK